MVRLTLFDCPYQQTVTDMIALFQQQLRDAHTEEERTEIRTAIASWEAAHGEPQKSTPRGSKRSMRCSNRKKKP